MDEPTAGMTPRSRRDLMTLATGLAERDNVAVLFTEHDMDIVFGFADRVLVLDRGELIARRVTGRDQGEPARPGRLPRTGRADRRVTRRANDDVSPGYSSGITGTDGGHPTIRLVSGPEWPYVRCKAMQRTCRRNPKGAPIMDNPLLTERRSVLDLSAIQGMSDYERLQATARMEQAMMLGDCALRVADRARAVLRSAAIVLLGAPTTQKRA